MLYAHSSKSLYAGMPDYEFNEYLESLVKSQIDMLKSCIEQLKVEIEISQTTPKKQLTSIDNKISSNKVFIVHGHNTEVKDSVARFLEKIDLEPIILHEKPNKGRTIIEKFSDYSDVGFAIVLLTADDFGCNKENKEDLKLRARQNVIFELGFFIGKISRERVCALYEKGVEIPSDYEGVIFIPLDKQGNWQNDIIRELKAVGFDIDANKIFEKR